MQCRTLTHPLPVRYQGAMLEMMPGKERFAHCWQPDRHAPWGTLTIIHGLGDHGERFANMANSLASSGLGVLAVDLVGHGRSPGRQGVVRSYDTLLDEVGNAVYAATRSWPKVPNFLLGQSMGGNLVLNWAMRRPFEAKSLDGLVAVAPMLRMARMPSPAYLRVGGWLANWLPHWRLRAPVDARQLCNDPAAQDAYRYDRRVHRRVSLRLGFSLLTSGEWALRHADKLRVPTLLMHGGEDTITNPAATRELADRLDADITFKLWQHGRHDLHHDLQRDTVTAFLLDWLRRRAQVMVQRDSRVARQAA